MTKELFEICNDVVEEELLETAKGKKLESANGNFSFFKPFFNFFQELSEKTLFLALQTRESSILAEEITELEVSSLSKIIASEALKEAMNLEIQKRLDEDALECASEEVIEEVNFLINHKILSPFDFFFV